MRRLAAASLFALTVVAAACATSDAGNIVTVNTTGTDIGIAFIDRNHNNLLDVTDTPLQGVRVTLFTTAGAKVNTTLTLSTGVYVFSAIPSGSYRIVVDTTTLGDSLRVSHMDGQDITVGNRDTAKTVIALGFPTSSAAVARTLAQGRKVEVDGIALNSWAAFGDSTLSIVDSSGAIRATRVAPVGVQAGDSISLVGTVSLLNGQPVLAAGTAFTLASAKPLPAPVALSTAAAASAGGGKYDATLAHVTGAVILSSQVTSAGELDLAVDDGSGVADVILSPRGPFTNTAAYVPGAVLDATGILAPAASGKSWFLRPRADADLQVSYPTVTIAQARKLPVGRRVQVVGLALNGWATFADSTVHIVDAGGAIRAIRVNPVNLFAGDSARFIATIAASNGETILSLVNATVLGTGRTLPDAQPLTTKAAAAAAGGTLDAALVQVKSAVVQDTLTLPTGDFRMHVDDGSGPITVILDRDLGLRLSPFIPTATLDLTGLLVPNTGGGSWFLKPRAASDTFVH